MKPWRTGHNGQLIKHKLSRKRKPTKEEQAELLLKAQEEKLKML
jgi:hypothetical protein